MTTRFHAGAAIMFRDAWREYEARKQSPAERWRSGSETLVHSWRCFMQSALSLIAWQALQLYLERWADLRFTWTKPGGYFFTRAGNRRKRIRKKLRPRHTVTMMDGVKRARKLYLEALAAEDCADDLTMATLALSGMICDGRSLSKRAVKVKSQPAKLAVPKVNRWPWPHSVTKRLRALRRQGLLTQPDWREVKF